LGVVGRAAGRILGLKVSGVYPTDIPLHARHATGSKHFEDLAWGFVRRLYQPMDAVYLPDRPLLDRLAERGFDRSRLHLLPPGKRAYDLLWGEPATGRKPPLAPSPVREAAPGGSTPLTAAAPAG
jgi:hypothetical protein